MNKPRDKKGRFVKTNQEKTIVKRITQSEWIIILNLRKKGDNNVKL